MLFWVCWVCVSLWYVSSSVPVNVSLFFQVLLCLYLSMLLNAGTMLQLVIF